MPPQGRCSDQQDTSERPTRRFSVGYLAYHQTSWHASLQQGLWPRRLLQELSIDSRTTFILEIVMHCALYGGFPTMINALWLAREVFDEHGVMVPDTVLPECSLEELEARGRALRHELQGVPGQRGYAASSRHLASDLFQLALQYGYGELWHRPDLDRQARVVCALAAFTALGGCDVQRRGFLQAARHVGFSTSEIVEILMQTAPYSGFPKALNALMLAPEVLR